MELVEPSRHVDDLARSVIGAALNVHVELGPGYLESVYQRALQIELEVQGIPFRSQVPIPVSYRGREIADHKVDLIIDGTLIAELKAVDQLLEIHRAQVISYLKAARLQLGLLINFKTKLLKDGIRRVIWDPNL